ncbi:MAG: type I glyceraldehyde-3-phosphate dehydrogenase [Geminicoccaceae bacterium]|nr:MAG: type I glyceraldehyde-3-phosphate dehydrogenase [Geminicoccaceae bacterium]
MRVGINGFGRIGRLAARAALQGLARNGATFDLVHVNEVKGGLEAAAHLLEFDSVHGRWRADFAVAAGALHIGHRRLGFSEHASPSDIPWADLGVDVVIESSGKFVQTPKLTPHLENGAKAVVVAAPVKDGPLNVVMGVNDHLYDPVRHPIVTAASCTTNCLAPVVKPIHEGLGIVHGVITTIHDVTNTQVIVDAPHQDLRRARSALASLVPTTTGSATAIGLIYPELQGKLNGHAVRVPLLNASLTDCVFEVSRPTTAAEVNALLREAADGPLQGILGVEHRPLVSVDYRSDPRSSIVDAPSTMVVDGTAVKVFAWYDNEMGYACRLVELTAKVVAALEAKA